MKKIFILLSAVFSAFASNSQNAIKLNINHKLGANVFAFNQAATNNIGNDFNLNRMQYYMSGFVITHDGAQTTTCTGVYALVDASAPAQIDLGNYPGITNVEAITFYIGVNTPENNADPSLWPSNHPLAPKSPSMHWGWASGYFFVALGGNSSPALNQALELHALGNSNYFGQTIVTTATVIGNEKIINIDANYEMALKNITISSGLVLHGSSGSNVTLLENFRDYVFTATSSNVGVKEEAKLNNVFVIYPNPSYDGKFIISTTKNAGNYSYEVTDVTGKVLESSNFNAIANNQITIQNRGIYFVSISQENTRVLIQKLIVQ